MPDFVAQKIRRAGSWSDAFELCILSYDERFLRRKVLKTAHEQTVLIDLPKATHLDDRDAFELTDGRLIEIIAAEEELLEVQGDLARLAWHIGNRHAPCQIEADRLLIQVDPVLEDMLTKLGANVRHISEAFIPEGGAYGLGRTHSHAH